MRNFFLTFFLMFFVLHGSGYATTCVPKTMTEPPAENSERYLRHGDNSYAYCGKSDDRFYDCDVNTFAVGYDRYAHQCTETGWKRISYDDIKPCDDDLLKVLIQYQYNGYTSTYNNGYDQTQYEWVLFHESIDNDSNYISINPNGSCKYPQDKFDAASEDCRTKVKGYFDVWKGENDVILCEPVEQININVTVQDADSEQPLDGVQIKYKDPFHDERDDLLTDAAGQATIEFNHSAKEIVIKFHKDGYANTSKIMSYLDAQSTPVIKLTKLPEAISGDKDDDEVTNTETPATCEDSGGTLGEDGTTCTCDSASGLKANTDNTLCECLNSNMTFNNETKKCTVSADDLANIPSNATQNTQPQQNKNERLEQATEDYKKAKENEQSLANRTLTAASTAATGLGLMTAASAYSEKQADEAAEQDMSAYLATFRCEYGKGQSSKAGNEEITLPGGNELLGYYSEYKSLADNLKNTKKALGMRPGIEQEVVYDKAESGLYKYASTGITDGAFTSLSRALTDPEGKDATEWNEQKDKTAKKLKGGAIAAGAGVAGGIGGDALMNTDMIQNIKDAFKK